MSSVVWNEKRTSVVLVNYLKFVYIITKTLAQILRLGGTWNNMRLRNQLSEQFFEPQKVKEWCGDPETQTQAKRAIKLNSREALLLGHLRNDQAYTNAV